MPAYTSDSGESGGRRQLMATGVLLVLAVTVAFLPAQEQQRIASFLRETVLSPFLGVQQGMVVMRARTADSEGLRWQLDSLVAVTAGHRTLAEENRRLRGLLELKERMGPAWIQGTVLRPGTAGSQSTFILDAGSEQGVEKYAPVISRQGVVGVVQEVHARRSIGIDWTHPDFAISAMDPDGITYGIVESRRGEFREADRMEFNGTAFHTRIEDGTVIVTSGQGMWPRGVPIGKIQGLAEADDGWRKSYWLRPMVEVGSVTHVLVGVGEERAELVGVWDLDSVRTDAEVALALYAREDSLRAMGDSVALLRTLLHAARPLRDSLLAALLLGGPDAPSAEWLETRLAAPAAGGPAGPGGTGGTTDAGAGAGRSGPPAAPAPAAALPRVVPTTPPVQQPPVTDSQPPVRLPSVLDTLTRFPRPPDTVLIPPPGGGRPPPDTLLGGAPVGAGDEAGGRPVRGWGGGSPRR